MAGPEVSEKCDVAVIGGGIVGLATARELLARDPGSKVCVLEGAPQIAQGQTGQTSGVIHAGIYYEPGSLKARLCVEGARLLYEHCDRHGIPYERCGKLIVATRDNELPALEELERRGAANGVPGLRRVAGGEIPELEPHARGVAALHSTATGVVDFAAVARSLAGELADRGAEIATGCEVSSVDTASRSISLGTPRGALRARHAVFCGGLWSDRLAAACGGRREPRIVPFRGAYLRLRPERRHLVRALIYPVPDARLPFLGVHLSRHADGEVTIGPTALLSPQGLRRSLAWP